MRVDLIDVPPPRSRRIWRLAGTFLAAAIGAGCAVHCSRWTAWDGKRPGELSVTEASHIALDPATPANRAKMAAAVLRREARRALDVLSELAARHDAVGVEARASLAHLQRAMDGR